VNTLYPASPVNYDPALIQPSDAFKKNVIRVAITIFLFFLFYLLLILLAFALLGGSIIAAEFFMSLQLHLLSLGLSAGIIALGIMVVIFLFKFVFSVSRDINHNRVEVKEAEQPELFAFIRQLSRDVKTPFPKKIFFSADANACVFYNSSFLSLFLPIRKNLEIGLALVNSLTVAEFKAVLGHEFGHFSQRSMRLGSYIYTVNRVLYNLVYEYDAWDRLLLKWASVGGIFGIFAGITAALINLLRSLLREAYRMITLKYMALSREMEYNADLIAASVAGEGNLISALRKIEFSAFTFNVTVDKLRNLAEQKLKCDDMYSRHHFLNKYYAAKLYMEVRNDMVVLKDDTDNLAVQSRVRINNQWASHPEFHERKLNLEKCKIATEAADQPAWVLLMEPEKVKQAMTAHFYKVIFDETAATVISDDEFETQVLEDDLESRINPAFNGFYTGRMLPDIDESLLKEKIADSIELEFDVLYSRVNKQKIDRYFQNKGDLEILEGIRDHGVNIKSFDFDGEKYERKQLESVISALREEIDLQETWFKEINQAVFSYHYNKATIKGIAERYLSEYKEVQSLQRLLQESAALHESLQELLQRMQGQPEFTADQVMSFNDEIRGHEQKAKKLLTAFPFPIESYAMNEWHLSSIRSVEESKFEFATSEEDFDSGRLNNTLLVVQIAYNAVYSEWRLRIIDFINFQYSLN
jgi:Zn-dependent protease with chaperone function